MIADIPLWGDPEPTPARETERTMLDRLNTRYGAYNGNGIRYTRAEHVKVTTGFFDRTSGGRICDYMAIDLWNGSTGPALHGHEVKVSRSDWLTELRDPSKADAFARYCDYWWLVVASKDIVRPGELPEGWGLMIASGAATVRAAVPAPRRAPLSLPRSVQATLTRAVTKTTIRLATQQDPATRFLARSMNLSLDGGAA